MDTTEKQNNTPTTETASDHLLHNIPSSTSTVCHPPAVTIPILRSSSSSTHEIHPSPVTSDMSNVPVINNPYVFNRSPSSFSNMLAKANTILNHAINVGLLASIDTITPGDGNCFYWAIQQQLARPDVHLLIDSSFRDMSHSELREAVCQFILQEQGTCEYIHNYHTMYDDIIKADFNNMLWSDFISDQGRNGVYASELFIKATAVMLCVNIHLTSELCTREQPFVNITPYFHDNADVILCPVLLLGNQHMQHFQSLIPTPTVTGSAVIVSYTSSQVQNIPTTVTANSISSVAESSISLPVVISSQQTTPVDVINSSIPVVPEIEPVNTDHSINLGPAIRRSTTRSSRSRSAAALLRSMRNKATTGETSEQHYLGPLSKTCKYCKAVSFSNETDFKCCHNGKVVLDDLIDYPIKLQELMTGVNRQAKNFQKNIRHYNSSHAFGSIAVKRPPIPGRGPPCYKICGQLYHNVGTLHPPLGVSPKYSSLYIVEASTAINNRLNEPHNADCTVDTMTVILDVLESCNPFIAAYKYMAQVEQEENRRAQEAGDVCKVVMYLRKGKDCRRYNAPRHEEVAVVFKGADGAPPAKYDIAIYPKDHPLQMLSHTSPNCDPMIYPLLFPHGEPGWIPYTPHRAERMTSTRNTTTLSQYYMYRTSVRADKFSPIHNGKMLFQQYLVDAYVKVESNNVNYLRNNQGKLRVEEYRGLMDHVERRTADHQAAPGRLVILPSSFVGSQRNLLQNYQDSMAMVGKFGKPDLFLTFTCNPKWKEIADNLQKPQRSCDRPDLIVRVFHQKCKELLHDLTVKQVFGTVVSYVYVIEFQKRSLPHCHMLIHLDEDDKPNSKEAIDSMISAQIPDPDKEPELYAIIKSSMIHGPCGRLNPQCICMKDGECSKKFPKTFQEETIESANGYPLYKRQQEGPTVTISNNILDSRWVVPYNPWLSSKFNAHLNLEVCASLQSLKYLYKYVYKGHDCAHLEIVDVYNHDEISHHLNYRYLSSVEAAYRIFEIPLYGRSHHIIRLPVHLESRHSIYFYEDHEDDALNRECVQETELTAWFQLNRNDPNARQYLYPDMPYHYVFDKKTGSWKQRKQGHSKVISRMYSIRPSDAERYYLRLLLLHKTGATSYDDLKTIDGRILTTFKEACLSMGLLNDDSQWQATMTEAAAFQMPRQLRALFAIILVYCLPLRPAQLWQDNKEAMTEDLALNMPQESADNVALAEIDGILAQSGKSLTDYGMSYTQQLIQNSCVAASSVEPIICEANTANTISSRDSLTTEQKAVADQILYTVQNRHLSSVEGKTVFYLDGPGGSGKTYLYNFLIKELQCHGLKVSACAWTGIAATLLTDGRTMHSLFKLPVPITDTSSCNISPSSMYADTLREQSLFILDEASMIPASAVSAVDRMLRDITSVNKVFGGMILLFGGDFRQVLPVIKGGNTADVVESCLKRSNLWPHFQQYSLTGNKRLAGNDIEFRDWLLDLGEGKLQDIQPLPHEDAFVLPSEVVVEGSLVDSIFEKTYDLDHLRSRVILCPTNEATFYINSSVLKHIPGEERVYFSSDEVVSDDDNAEDLYMPEFLHTLTPSGMPLHRLTLKVGAPIMLLRNLNIKAGLCNGTRLIVKELHNNSIVGEVLSGERRGAIVLIPKVKLAPSDTSLPFVFSRCQFPIRLAFSMTINKAQGQTFEKVGIYLDKPCFSHGQMYVAFSRARRLQDIRVKVIPSSEQGELDTVTFTKNIVHKEVL